MNQRSAVIGARSSRLHEMPGLKIYQNSHPPHICAGANLPPWSLAGAWGEVVRTSAQKPGPVLKRALADVTAAPLSLEKVLRELAGQK